MPSQWYFMKGEEKCGPVRSKVLRALAEAGQLEATDLVWKDGLSKWKPAGEIKGLFVDAVSVTATESADSDDDTESRTKPLGITLIVRFAAMMFFLVGYLSTTGWWPWQSIGIWRSFFWSLVLSFFFCACGVSLWRVASRWDLPEKRTKQQEKLAALGRVRCNSCGHVGTLGTGDEVKGFGSDWSFHRVCEKCGSEDWVRVKENEASS